MNAQEITGKRSSPRVLVFACRWCALIGADAAGRGKTDLPVSFRVIPVECASIVEPDSVLRALASGADGVAVMGCHLGGCRFNDANHVAFKRMEALGDLLDTVGIGRRRLLLSFGTAHEGRQFAEVLGTFLREIEPLPPLAIWRKTLLNLPTFR
jgi:F420-non-reducing hydrogenase iron-sulfur subunit